MPTDFSYLTGATVRVKFGAVDITALVRRQKERRAGNFIGFAHAPKGSSCGLHFHHLLMEFFGWSQSVPARGGCRAGNQHIDLIRRGARSTIQPRAKFRIAARAGDDDDPAHSDVRSLFLHLRNGGFRNERPNAPLRDPGLAFQLVPAPATAKPRCSIRDGLPLLSFRTSSRIEERHESVLSLRYRFVHERSRTALCVRFRNMSWHLKDE